MDGAAPTRPRAQRQNASSLPGWLREPLLQLEQLGGLLFGLDKAVSARANDARLVAAGPELNTGVKPPAVDEKVPSDCQATRYAVRHEAGKP